MSYSSDVFFKPWVGLDYPYGWFLAPNNALVRGDEHARGFKVMVLGKEHYCSIRHPEGKNAEENDIYKSTGYVAQSSLVRQCTMHSHPYNNKCNIRCENKVECPTNVCAHLFTCKDMTEGVIKGHIFADKKDNWIADALDIYPFNAKSHANFEKIFDGHKRKDIWNGVLFSNFFQRGMPNLTGNDDFHISTEKERACKAFADILKTHAPDIVWAWNDWNPIMKSIVKDYYNTCIRNNGITINICDNNGKFKYTDPINPDIHVPRLYILQDKECMHDSQIYAVDFVNKSAPQLYKNDIKIEKKKELPFLVLKYNRKIDNEPQTTLMVFSVHPYSWRFKKPAVSLYSQYLKIIFKDYNNIINWDCSPNLNNTYFSQNPRLTMIYGSKLTLLNP